MKYLFAGVVVLFSILLAFVSITRRDRFASFPIEDQQNEISKCEDLVQRFYHDPSLSIFQYVIVNCTEKIRESNFALVRWNNLVKYWEFGVLEAHPEWIEVAKQALVPPVKIDLVQKVMTRDRYSAKDLDSILVSDYNLKRSVLMIPSTSRRDLIQLQSRKIYGHYTLALAIPNILNGYST
jgi:hypothetical protein